MILRLIRDLRRSRFRTFELAATYPTSRYRELVELGRRGIRIGDRQIRQIRDRRGRSGARHVLLSLVLLSLVRGIMHSAA